MRGSASITQGCPDTRGLSYGAFCGVRIHVRAIGQACCMIPTTTADRAASAYLIAKALKPEVMERACVTVAAVASDRGHEAAHVRLQGSTRASQRCGLIC